MKTKEQLLAMTGHDLLKNYEGLSDKDKFHKYIEFCEQECERDLNINLLSEPNEDGYIIIDGDEDCYIDGWYCIDSFIIEDFKDWSAWEESKPSLFK